MAFLPLHFPRSVMHNVQTNLKGDLSAFDAYKQNTGCAIALEAVVFAYVDAWNQSRGWLGEWNMMLFVYKGDLLQDEYPAGSDLEL